jgi:hypothetical protein
MENRTIGFGGVVTSWKLEEMGSLGQVPAEGRGQTSDSLDGSAGHDR